MKWIKASEKEPPPHIDVYFKVDGIFNLGFFNPKRKEFYSAKHERAGYIEGLQNIEWLDESDESPISNQPIEQKEGPEPILIKAGDWKLQLSGRPPLVDCRVVAEDYYQKLLQSKPKVEQADWREELDKWSLTFWLSSLQSQLSTANQKIITLQGENEEWKVECERLAAIAEHWQNRYYEANPPFQKPNIDNL